MLIKRARPRPRIGYIVRRTPRIDSSGASGPAIRNAASQLLSGGT